MSASVTMLFDRKPRQISDDEIAAVHIRTRLVNYVSSSVLAQATARALRHLHQGQQLQTAIDRACKWALCAVETNPEPPTAA